MNRKLIALNLALVVLIGAAAWRLWDVMQEADARLSAIVDQPLEKVEPPPADPQAPPEPVRAGDYYDIARQLLFFPDRNPDIVIEAAPPKPVPPMPVAHGVLDLGSGPTIILSADDSALQRAYRVGDEYEQFRIARITDTTVVFEWEGELLSRSLEELKPATVAPPIRTRTTAAAKPKPAKAKAAVLGEKVEGPSKIDMGGGFRACQQGDTSPPGTVAGGFRKVVSQTPFGSVCRWEPVK